jgi:hypothetical protein
MTVFKPIQSVEPAPDMIIRHVTQPASLNYGAVHLVTDTFGQWLCCGYAPLRNDGHVEKIIRVPSRSAKRAVHVDRTRCVSIQGTPNL